MERTVQRRLAPGMVYNSYCIAYLCVVEVQEAVDWIGLNWIELHSLSDEEFVVDDLEKVF